MKKVIKLRTNSSFPSKLNLKMRITTSLLLLITLFQLQANESYGQKTKVTLDYKNVSLETVFDKIEALTEFKFIYKDKQINYRKKVSITVKKEALSSVLKKLFSDSSISFSLNSKQIILKPSKAVSISVVENKTIQKIKITGIITDINGLPLPNASVLEKGTTNGVISDFDGKFSLNVANENAILIISYVGFITKEAPLNGKTTLDIKLLEDAAKLDEIVIIGYGTAIKKNLTGSISSLKAEELEDQPITSFDQGLAGRLAGVDISQSGGAPGGAVEINIRGVASLSGGNSPLIVVDGVPLSSSSSDSFSQGQSANSRFDAGYSVNPLSTINPSDISSVEVLKDAAAAAIYGSRGSNGVIIITTKRGRSGDKPKINFNTYAGFQRVIKKVDVMNAQQFAEYSKLARDNSWIAKDPLNNSASDPQNIRSAEDRYAPYLIPYLNGETGLTDTDWQDEIFRTAAIQSYDLSITGGTEKTNYFVSGNYLEQEGIVINSGVKRYGARINLETKISDNVRFGINLNPSFTDNNIVQTEANWWKEGVIQTALMYHPNLEPRNADGTLRLGELLETSQSGQSNVALIENPVALAELIENSLEQTRILGNTFVEFNFASDFTFKTSFAADFNYLDRFYYRPKNLHIRFEPTPTTNFNYAWSNNSSSLNLLTENTLKYDKEFKDHKLNLLLGQSAQKETNKRQYLEGRNFPNDNVRTLNAAQSTDGFSEERAWSLLSYFGRATYNYNDKYLLSASLRRDGSSRFGKDTKWGWFPAVSAGWRVSNEDFWSDESLVNEFKIRASYGLTGNTEIPFFGGAALLGESNYIFNNAISAGLAPSTSPNPNLSWETTKTTDIGINLSLFNNKLNITADYYNSQTEDLLLNVPIPGATGFTSSLQNVGELENTGYELSIGTVQNIGSDFVWQSNFNISTNSNKIKSLGAGQTQFLANSGLNDPAFIVRVGESIGSFYGYNVLGVFETQEQFDNTPTLDNQNQGVGDFIYEDVNNDGDINEDDRTILGNAFPSFSWGFSNTFKFKGFDFSFNIIGKHGFEKFNALHRYTAETWGNNLSVYLNDNAPRPVWGVGTNSHTRPSSWHVEDASFIRLRNLTLGYNIPEGIFKNSAISSLRLYASGLNLITITDYSGYDPEVSNQGEAIRRGEDFGNYPSSKTFTVGLNMSF